MKTNLNAKPISELNDLKVQGKVHLRPSYQRRPVWGFKNKVYLIDTILQGLPIPKFFIKISVDNVTGKTIYEVVDGQQRLTTIFEFINGKTIDGKDFILSRKRHPKPETFPDEFEGLTFKTLPENLLSNFWRYKLSLEELESATEKDINDMFIRLNLSGAKLNKQELRNAAYNGDFKSMVYEVSSEFDDFLLDNKILSANNIKRMIDAEFISELFACMIRGLQDKKKTLDKIYEDYDSVDDDLINTLKNSFRKTMYLIDGIFGNELRTTRFKSKNDFYSLFYCLYDLTISKNRKIKPENFTGIKNTLIELSKNVRLDSSNPELVKYYECVINSGDTIQARRIRNEILSNLIEPFCVERDSRRIFPEFDKQFLWHNSIDKKCAICGDVIEDYSDYEIDHIVAWDNGGSTDLSNAQLTHRSCNRKKSNN